VTNLEYPPIDGLDYFYFIKIEQKWVT
jgi:hypothetical protein